MHSRFVSPFTLALAPFALAAQEPDTAAARDTLRPWLLPPVIVTGTRVPLEKQHVGFAASVLEKRDLDAEPTPYAAWALLGLPGVFIDQDAGVHGPTVLRLRGGEEPFTQVMFDGNAVNLTGGFLDLQGLTLTNVERVEVARGPQSVMYGSSAMSGVVQFITRRGQVGPLQAELLAEGGRATERGGQARSELTVHGGAPALRYSAGVGVTYNRGIYEIAHNLLTRDASLRLDAEPGARWSVTGTLRYMDIESDLPVRNPGVTRAPLDPNQRDGRTRLISSVLARFSASPSWQHRLSVSSYRDDFFYEDGRDGLDPSAFPFFLFDFDFTFASLLWRHTAEYSATHRLAPGGAALALSYGARAEREALDVEQGGDFGEDMTSFGRDNQAAFAELQGRVGPRVYLIAGTRLEKFEGLSAHLMPRASLALAAVPDRLTLRAAGGRAFKAPNLQQQFLDNPFTDPNPDLEPETSVSWEVGASAHTADRMLTVSTTFFRQRHLGLIRTVPVEGTTKQTNRNLGESRSTGIEVEVERWWTPRWRTGVNATWVEAEVVDNTGLAPDLFPEGGRLPGVPTLMGNLFVEARLSDAVSARARGTLVGEQITFSERFSGTRETLDPYFLLGLVLHARFGERFSVFVRGENLLDEDYDPAFDRPGTPPTVVVGVRLRN